MRAFIVFAFFQSTRLILAHNEQVDSDWSTTPDGTTSTTELPQPLCPPDKSLYTREDIETLIDYIAKSLSITKTINISYYYEAIEVREKHMNDFKEFQKWYQNRPEHLKHVIEDIGFVRYHVEPLVKDIGRSLDEYPGLQENFNMKLHRTSSLLKKLNRYNNICENNCENNDLIVKSRRSNYNGYYCSSLEYLYNKINIKLREFVKHLSSTMRNQVPNDDMMFTNKIALIKNNLKDVALKQFGRTMYDVLLLQDEYHHFIQDLMKIDVNSDVYSIKETHLLIDSKLLEFEKSLEKYGTYCRNCNSNVPVTNFRRSDSGEIDLLDELLRIKYEEIEYEASDNYSAIFKDLNSMLDNVDSNDIYLKNLKPLQDEVNEMLQDQRKNFEELKSMAPPELIEKVNKLSVDSKHLLSILKREVDLVKSKLPKRALV